MINKGWFATLRNALGALWGLFNNSSALNAVSSPSLKTDWGMVIKKLMRVSDDIRESTPRPAAPSMTRDEISATLDKVIAIAPTIKAWVDTHPGELTAFDDLCDALVAAGFVWAAYLKSGVDAAPGALEEAVSWLPTIRMLLGEFAPAPIGIPGAWAGARGHV